MASPISDPWGIILIGVFISLILFGIIVMQVFTYYNEYSKESTWRDIFVGILFFLDALSSALAMAWMYYLFVDNWGSIEAFTTGDWLLAADPMVAGIIAFMVQGFFAWRIHVISKDAFLTSFIVICSVLTLCGGIGTGIAVLWVQSYARFAEFRQIAVIWLISAVVGDVSITAALTYHLRRRKGNFEATDRLLDRIVQLTVQNGFLTALVALVDIILYLSTPKPYHISLSFLMPKLYSNTVLSSLNARKKLQRDMGTDSGTTKSISRRPADVVKLDGRSTRPEVFVEVHEMSDAEHIKNDPEWQ